MANIKTADCKQAIVQFVLNNPGYIGAQFCDQHGKSGTPFKATADGRVLSVADFELPAQKVKSWKRCEKRKIGTVEAASHRVPVGTIARMFECSSGDEAQNTYEDQLRAYTYDDGQKIIKVEIAGE